MQFFLGTTSQSCGSVPASQQDEIAIVLEGRRYAQGLDPKGNPVCTVTTEDSAFNFSRNVCPFAGVCIPVQNQIERTGINTNAQRQSTYIPKKVQILSAYFLLSNIGIVVFEHLSLLERINKGVFSYRVSLQRIYLPSSLIYLSINCFERCVALRVVGFEPGSRLKEIEQDAFTCCSALWSICYT